MINKLIIGKKIVEIETDIVYESIELKYKGDLFIKNLMPDNYIVGKDNQKILIVRFNKKKEIIRELFEYTGYCDIYYGRLVYKEGKDLTIENLYIEKIIGSTWNTMGKKKFLDGTTRIQKWDNLTTDYDLLYNLSRNDYKSSFQVKTLVDRDTGVKTVQRNTVKTISNAFKKDINLSTISKLQKAIGEEQNIPKKDTKKIRSTY